MLRPSESPATSLSARGSWLLPSRDEQVPNTAYRDEPPPAHPEKSPRFRGVLAVEPSRIRTGDCGFRAGKTPRPVFVSVAELGGSVSPPIRLLRVRIQLSLPFSLRVRPQRSTTPPWREPRRSRSIGGPRRAGRRRSTSAGCASTTARWPPRSRAASPSPPEARFSRETPPRVASRSLPACRSKHHTAG